MHGSTNNNHLWELYVWVLYTKYIEGKQGVVTMKKESLWHFRWYWSAIYKGDGMKKETAPVYSSFGIQIVSRVWVVSNDFPRMFPGSWRVQVLKGWAGEHQRFVLLSLLFASVCFPSCFMLLQTKPWWMFTGQIWWLRCRTGWTAPVADHTSSFVAEST